jgi:cell division protein FtsQ
VILKVSRDIATKKAKERREKIKQIRRKRQLRLAVVFLLTVLVLWVLIWLYQSDLFRVKKVEIAGNHRLSDSQIEKICAINPGASLIRLPLREIENRLLKNPWIESVEISRSFPNTLRIQLTERKAIAVIPVQDGGAIVDREGLVLEKRLNFDKANLPIIKDLDARRVNVGQKIRSKSFSNAISCLSHLDDKLRSSLSIVSAPTVDKLSLYTNKGVEILYGKAENFAKKNYIIRKILAKDDKVKFIDVRVVSNPVIKRLP